MLHVLFMLIYPGSIKNASRDVVIPNIFLHFWEKTEKLFVNNNKIILYRVIFWEIIEGKGAKKGG